MQSLTLPTSWCQVAALNKCPAPPASQRFSPSVWRPEAPGVCRAVLPLKSENSLTKLKSRCRQAATPLRAPEVDPLSAFLCNRRPRTPGLVTVSLQSLSASASRVIFPVSLRPNGPVFQDTSHWPNFQIKSRSQLLGGQDINVPFQGTQLNPEQS